MVPFYTHLYDNNTSHLSWLSFRQSYSNTILSMKPLKSATLVIYMISKEYSMEERRDERNEKQPELKIKFVYFFESTLAKVMNFLSARCWQANEFSFSVSFSFSYSEKFFRVVTVIIPRN